MMLLEALIAILIFSMGILAIVGMQAAAIKASTDAKYRSEASLLVNQLVGQMWVSNRTVATLQANFQGGGGLVGTPGAGYTAWLNDVQNALPGTVANAPSVVITPSTITTGSDVNITVFWQLPSDTAVHQYSTIVPII